MDVHPPHQPIHGWRDFFIHLGTITIGLCIALALESAAEAVHHRNIVREASARLQHEIDANHTLYAKNAQRLQRNRERLKQDIAVLLELRSGRKPADPHLHWGWEWDAYDDSAWRSARDIGAIPYMSPGALEKFSGVYGQQEYVNQFAIGIFDDESKTPAPLFITGDPARLLPAEIQSMLVGAAELDLRLGTLQSMMKGLDDLYTTAQKSP